MKTKNISVITMIFFFVMPAWCEFDGVDHTNTYHVEDGYEADCSFDKDTQEFRCFYPVDTEKSQPGDRNGPGKDQDLKTQNGDGDETVLTQDHNGPLDPGAKESRDQRTGDITKKPEVKQKTAETPDKKDRKVTITNGQRVLYIGDSHSVFGALDARGPRMRLGHVILKAFATKGVGIDYYAACGASVQSWNRGGTTRCGYRQVSSRGQVRKTTYRFPSLKKVLDNRKHAAVIVNLGDNNFSWSGRGVRKSGFSATTKRNLIAAVREMGELISRNKKCFFVGPTYHIPGKYYHKHDSHVDKMYIALEEALTNKCDVIDSRPMVSTRVKNDGLHHVNADSQKWGQEIVKSLEGRL